MAVNSQFVHVEKRSPFEYLDDHTAAWLSKIKEAWRLWEKNEKTVAIINQFFRGCPYPHMIALRAAVNAGDYGSTKQNTLAVFIMKCFCSWKESNPQEVSIQAKKGAFALVTKQKNATFSKLVVEAFEIKEHKLIFLNRIHALIEDQKYKEACQDATLLELFDEYDVREFVLPLVFQDKFALVEEFLKGSRRCQIGLVKKLDKIMIMKYPDEQRKEAERMMKEGGIVDGQPDRMSGKPLHKLLKKIMKLYDIPATTCPNFNYHIQAGALRFLLRKRYCQDGIDEENWEDMIMDHVGNDRRLHEELMVGLQALNQPLEAKKWAQRFNLPYPNNLGTTSSYKEIAWRKSGPGGYSKEGAKASSDGENANMKIHQLKIPDSDIHVVDTVQGLKRFLDREIAGVTMFGMDCEWKPMIEAGKVAVVAIIQLATFERVHLIDVTSLLPATPNAMWDSFVRKIFYNSEILKIGFDLDSDFKNIRTTFPTMSNFRPVGPGYVDLKNLWSVLERYKLAFPFIDKAGPSTKKGLPRLVEITLGERLDKSDQLSNWEKRPLKQSQIRYAAMDAYCPLEVYAALVSAANRQNIPFDDVVACVTGSNSDGENSRKKKSGPDNWGATAAPAGPPATYVAEHALPPVNCQKVQLEKHEAARRGSEKKQGAKRWVNWRKNRRARMARNDAEKAAASSSCISASRSLQREKAAASSSCISASRSLQPEKAAASSSRISASRSPQRERAAASSFRTSASRSPPRAPAAQKPWPEPYQNATRPTPQRERAAASSFRTSASRSPQRERAAASSYRTSASRSPPRAPAAQKPWPEPYQNATRSTPREGAFANNGETNGMAVSGVHRTERAVKPSTIDLPQILWTSGISLALYWFWKWCYQRT